MLGVKGMQREILRVADGSKVVLVMHQLLMTVEQSLLMKAHSLVAKGTQLECHMAASGVQKNH